MKLIIDIPEDNYEYIKRLNAGYTDYYITLRLYDAARNGTPLDDIKAEIDEEKDKVLSEDINYAEGLERALIIIDKHISGKDGE